jgi:hypothetical protein
MGHPSSATPWSQFHERLRLRYGTDPHQEAWLSLAVPGFPEYPFKAAELHIDANAISAAIQRLAASFGQAMTQGAPDKGEDDPYHGRSGRPTRRPQTTR